MRKWIILALGLLAAAPAWAQDWPAKPVRFIVPCPPGGGTDVIARIVAKIKVDCRRLRGAASAD